MSARELVEPILGAAQDFLAGEVDYWQEEITRPWRRGRPGRPAEVGRWIGLGLVAGAAVLGIVAAIRSERPWE